MIFFRNSIGIFGIFDSYKPMRAIALVILRCAFALHATRDQIPFRYDDIGTRYGTVGAISPSYTSISKQHLFPIPVWHRLPLAAAWARGTRDLVRDEMLETLSASLTRYAREA
jgi:hypothetical protein